MARRRKSCATIDRWSLAPNVLAHAIRHVLMTWI